jgi:hypothetical protein
VFARICVYDMLGGAVPQSNLHFCFCVAYLYDARVFHIHKESTHVSESELFQDKQVFRFVNDGWHTSVIIPTHTNYSPFITANVEYHVDA